MAYAVGNQQYIAVVSGEGSRMGQNIRRLDSTLGAPNPQITLVVFALPATGGSLTQ